MNYDNHAKIGFLSHSPILSLYRVKVKNKNRNRSACRAHWKF